MSRYDLFALVYYDEKIYSSRTISAIKKYCKKHNIDPHAEGYKVKCDSDVYSLSEFHLNTGMRNSTIKQSEFSKTYKHSRYKNVGLIGGW